MFGGRTITASFQQLLVASHEVGLEENWKGVVQFDKVETDKKICNVLRRSRKVFWFWNEGQLGPHFPPDEEGKFEVIGAQHTLARPS